MKDYYYSIASEASASFSEQRSKFLSFAYPVSSEEEALSWVEFIRNEYYDARHVCWAYRLGASGENTRANDDGEPSGTAGRPILGQIVSADLTNIIVLVVRYFGGIKLGTSGLIDAYKTATAEVLAIAPRVEHILYSDYELSFNYDLMGLVMRLVKDYNAKVKYQNFQESCLLGISMRMADASLLLSKVESIYQLEIKLINEPT